VSTILEQSTATLNASDLFPLWSTGNSDTRKVSLSALVDYLNGALDLTDGKITQYAAPSATGFTVTLYASGASVWLILTPTAGFAAGALVLPPVGMCVDRQEILINCTQSVTTLTINANGATVTGAPATLAANAFFRLRFDAVTQTWYRVG
jgi:hypothetical protein